jgi:hypothetical protein
MPISQTLFNLYFCDESPLQILCASEAQLHFNTKDSFIIIGFKSNLFSGKNNQYTYLLPFLGWKSENVILWPYLTTRSSLINYLIYIISLIFFSLRLRGKVDTIFLGDIRNPRMLHLRNAIRPLNTVALDDGLGTKIVQQRISSSAYYKPTYEYNDSFQDTFIKFLLCLYENPPYKLRSIKFFTLYDDNHISRDFIYLHTLKKVKTYLTYSPLFSNVSSINLKPNPIFIIGSPFFSFIGLDLDIHLFCTAFKYFEESNRSDIIYLPHRRDSKEKLSSLSSIGYSITKPELPLELFFMSLDYCTQISIFGFYSAALTTLKIMNIQNIVSIASFYPDLDYFPKKHHASISSAYNAIFLLKIPTINITLS